MIDEGPHFGGEVHVRRIDRVYGILDRLGFERCNKQTPLFDRLAGDKGRQDRYPEPGRDSLDPSSESMPRQPGCR